MPQINVQSVTRMISEVASRYIASPGEAQYSPAYIAALGAVLTLLERRTHADPEMAEALGMARQALNGMQARVD